MGRDFLPNLHVFGADAASRFAPGALADPLCPECVTFVAGPRGDGSHHEAAPHSEDGSPLAHLFSPNTSLRVDWASAADPGPAPPADDEEAFHAYARAFATARFARRVLDGDTHAWVEALASYRERFRLPGQVRSTIRPEDDGSLRIGVELPAPGSVAGRRGDTRSGPRTRYDDLCAGILLAFACDAFRVLPPAADSLYMVGYRREADPATGHARYAILMRLATDRASLEGLDLARATPSAAFEHLGGAAKQAKGELVALAYETELARVL
jgi:hypothetical protein